MTEPIVTCPNCQSDIRLTESLAAPLVRATRKQFEREMADKDREIASREEAIRAQQRALERDKATIDQQIAEKLIAERKRIADEESVKARRLAAADLDQKSKELADLQSVLKQREQKLAEAQKAQADVMRKERELEDAKRGDGSYD